MAAEKHVEDLKRTMKGCAACCVAGVQAEAARKDLMASEAAKAAESDALRVRAEAEAAKRRAKKSARKRAAKAGPGAGAPLAAAAEEEAGDADAAVRWAPRGSV